jgi:hypothetical protein
MIVSSLNGFNHIFDKTNYNIHKYTLSINYYYLNTDSKF